MEKKKNMKLEITEIFMAKAGRLGWDRCFHGTIKRDFDVNGNPVVYSKINVGDGFIIAQATNQDELGEQLDELVKMVLDLGLHDDNGVFTDIYSMKYFHN